MRREHWLLAVCLAAALAGIFRLSGRERAALHAAFVPARAPSVRMVIDAGHGGEDGGAVSLNGTVESGVNLEIATRLDDLMAFLGAPAVMTRTDDTSQHDSDAETLREKKRSDLKNRVALINGVENGVLVSIHQNIYPNTRENGAQVFYAGEESRDLAVSVQTALVAALDPDNTRKAAHIPESVYLMKNVTRPAILVECGFLSNPAESRRLCDAAYQTRIAVTLAGAFLDYYECEDVP